MKKPLTFIFIFAIAVVLYVIYDNIWGLSSNWQIVEVLAMWQIAITAIALTTAAAAVYYAAIQLRQNREGERKAREESLLQIRGSLKSELETNLQLLQSDQFRIWAQAPEDEKGNIVILTRPLRTSCFELVAGREDLKYLKPHDTLSSIAGAYNQIKDFNSYLESWLRRGVYELEKGHYSFHGEIDLSVLTTKYLTEQKKVTITAIEEVLKVLQLLPPSAI